MLEAHQLACQRGERLLFRKLDFTARPGELWRIAGPNGMGKTSLLRLLAGLAQPATGDVHWQNAALARQRDTFHAALLYLGHSAAQHDLLSPLENLRFACRSAGIIASDAECISALDALGLTRQRDLPCKHLSQGQRRRVGLARLPLATSRTLWLLDEPFAALDVAAVDALAARIDAHVDAGGIVLLTTHQDVAFRHPLRVLDVSEFSA